MRNRFRWVRQDSARMAACSELNVLYLDDGVVFDYPAYDNGKYIVIDIVKDIQWAVVSYELHRMGTYINKYEAIEYADDLLDSDRRYGEEYL